MNSNIIDICIITPLPEESKKLEEKLLKNNARKIGKYGGNEATYRSFTFWHYRNYIICTHILSRMGQLESLAATKDVINLLKPKYIVIFGIAGGNKDKVDIGDVVVSDQVFYYEMAKIKNGIKYLRPIVYEISGKILQPIINFISNYNKSNIKVHIGTIASGDKVISDEQFQEEIYKFHSAILAFEMEAAGAAKVSRDVEIEFLTIRGISDLADKRKDDNYRNIALENAATFLVDFISEEPFIPLHNISINIDILDDMIKSNLQPSTKINDKDLSELEKKFQKYVNSKKNYFRDQLPKVYINPRLEKINLETLIIIDDIDFNSDELFKKNLILFEGKSGYGKTTILRKMYIHFESRWNEDKNGKIPIWMDIFEFEEYGFDSSYFISKLIDAQEKINLTIEDIYIRKGKLAFFIDDIHNIKNNFDKFINAVNFLLANGNSIILTSRFFDQSSSKKFVSLNAYFYKIRPLNKETVYEYLRNKFPSLVPTEDINNLAEIFTIPFIFNITMQIPGKNKIGFTKYSITEVVETYVGIEIDRIKIKVSENHKIIENIKSILASIGCNMIIKNELNFDKDLIIQIGNNIDMSIFKELLSSSLFIKWGNKYSFVHDYIRDFFAGLYIIKQNEIQKYMDKFIEEPEKWGNVYLFIFKKANSKDREKIIEALLKNGKNDVKYLFYLIWFIKELQESELPNDKLDNIFTIIKESIENSDEQAFYKWLPEIMSAFQFTKIENLKIKFLKYLNDKIDSREIKPRMLNLIHFYPQIIEYANLTDKLKELAKNLVEKTDISGEQKHLLYSIIEVFYVSNTIDESFLKSILKLTNDIILKGQIYFVLKENVNLKSEFKNYFKNLNKSKEDSSIIGHFIIEAARMDYNYFGQDIQEILLRKLNDQVILYHTVYASRFVANKDNLLNLIKDKRRS